MRNDYKQIFLDSIRDQNRQSKIITFSRIQALCKAHIIDLGYFDSNRVYPRSIAEINTVLYVYNNHFYSILKSEGGSFSKALEEVEKNFKIIDIVNSHDNVDNYFKYELKPKKIESQISNVIVYDIETYDKNKDVPNWVSLDWLGKIAEWHNRDLTNEEYKKCKTDTNFFDENDRIEKMMDWLSGFKGEPTKLNGRIVEYKLQLKAHNGSGFDKWVVLNILSSWYGILNFIRIGKTIISLKVLKRNVKLFKKVVSQFIKFRNGMADNNSSFKNNGCYLLFARRAHEKRNKSWCWFWRYFEG